jgi:YbbR domain-containing protein
LNMPVQRSHYFRSLKWTLFFLILCAGAIAYLRVPFSCEKNISIPIRYNNLPKNLAVTDFPAFPLDICLKGPGPVIDTLSKMELDYTADLSDVHEGKNRIAILVEQIPLPDRICAKHFNPSHITVTLEKKISKKLPVIPRCVGKPAFGWLMTDKKAAPETVLLKGPESILSPMTAVSTQPIDLTNLTGTIKQMVPLDLLGENTICPIPEKITVEITITEQVVTKIFKNIRIYSKNTSNQAIVQPEVIDITIQGPLKQISGNFSQDDIDAYVDLDKLSPGVHVKPATINLPIGISMIKADPEIFTVQITKKPI